MYVAAKGGERAIENAHRLLAYERRGDPSVPELSLAQIGEQLTLAVDRVMNEGSLYDRELAALAIKQARGDEGFLLALGYSTQRGYGRNHPFAGEIRLGEAELEFAAEEVGFAVPLGRITVTECQMINQFRGSASEPPRFTRGYGLGFGQCERKAMAMALVDRALRARELGEEIRGPAQDEEFVLSHSDNVQATGFVEHLKLPHYVDFQAELGLVRRLRAEFEEAGTAGSVREAAE